MLSPPPLPAWNALHVVAVHLPIGAFAAAPILILLAMLFGRRRESLAVAALALMLFATGGAFLAVSTGEAAESIAIAEGDAEVMLQRHEEVGEMARNAVAAVTGTYALVVLVAFSLRGRLKPAGWVIPHALVLAACIPVLLLLANAGHLGGRLVHQYGVHALIRGEPVADEPGDEIE